MSVPEINCLVSWTQPAHPGSPYQCLRKHHCRLRAGMRSKLPMRSHFGFLGPGFHTVGKRRRNERQQRRGHAGKQEPRSLRAPGSPTWCRRLIAWTTATSNFPPQRTVAQGCDLAVDLALIPSHQHKTCSEREKTWWCKLMVVALEMGGCWGGEAKTFMCLLAQDCRIATPGPLQLRTA